MINQLVNQRYDLVEKLGESPLFSVYKARDRTANRVVAVKVVQSSYRTNQKFMKQLLDSAAAAASLNQPNIARIFDSGEEDGYTYFATEYVRGINLKERIRRIAPFTVSVAIDFACAIGEALQYAHSMGVSHGDLRPQNIIVSPEGALKVTDFGIQQALSASEQAQQEILERSAPYHAPELSTRSAGSVTGDIYALGVILYEMLTGTTPFTGESVEAIADQHAFTKIPSLKLLNQGVPRSVEGIVLKCLQKRAEDRYRTASELLTDLKAVRDALRFGKPLSWSPIDLDAEEQGTVPNTAGIRNPAAAAPRIPQPVAEVAASSTLAMPSRNRLRAQNERVSIYLRAALVFVTCVIFAALIGFAWVWSSMWSQPASISIPMFEGKPIEEVRHLTEGMKVRLIEHAEYSDKPKDIVYKSDPRGGGQTRQNHVINVWFSKGPAYVNVPDVANMSKEEAIQKLKDTGLTVGQILTEANNSVPSNHVIRQDVSSRKRVFHDTPVGIIVSDGPKIGDLVNPDMASQPNGTDPSKLPGASAQPDPSNLSEADQQPHTFERNINIPRDTLGRRKVRIEYKDSMGTPVSVIDEERSEGDKIPVSFTYYGKMITLTIYYDDKPQWSKTFDPLSTANERVQ